MFVFFVCWREIGVIVRHVWLRTAATCYLRQGLSGKPCSISMHLRSLHASADFSNRSKEKSHKRASYVFASGGHRSRTSVRGQGLFHLVDVDAHTKGLGRLSFSNIRAKSHHPSRVRMAQESSRSARGVSSRKTGRSGSRSTSGLASRISSARRLRCAKSSIRSAKSRLHPRTC